MTKNDTREINFLNVPLLPDRGVRMVMGNLGMDPPRNFSILFFIMFRTHYFLKIFDLKP